MAAPTSVESTRSGALARVPWRPCQQRRQRPTVRGAWTQVDSRLAWLDASNSKIRARAAAALTDAVQTRQQQEIGAALQVFVALVALPEAVERAERELLKLAKAAVATALDTSTLGADGEGQARGARARGPANAAAAAGWKAELWERLEDLMEVLEGKLSQARPCRPPARGRRSPAARGP